jgi:hypothetical protein
MIGWNRRHRSNFERGSRENLIGFRSWDGKWWTFQYISREGWENLCARKCEHKKEIESRKTNYPLEGMPAPRHFGTLRAFAGILGVGWHLTPSDVQYWINCEHFQLTKTLLWSSLDFVGRIYRTKMHFSRKCRNTNATKCMHHLEPIKCKLRSLVLHDSTIIDPMERVPVLSPLIHHHRTVMQFLSPTAARDSDALQGVPGAEWSLNGALSWFVTGFSRKTRFSA